MSKLASIERIQEINPIFGADRIEVAKVLGYEVVINRDKFKVGDLIVYHQPDTVVPERPEYEFLRKNGFRIKTAKFKRQISNGFVLSIDEMIAGINGTASKDFFTEGLDVTEIVGLVKYEKPIPASLAGKVAGSFPSYIRRTDELNGRAYPDVVKEMQEKEAVITLKMDGSSGTFFLKDEKFGVCSRNLELKEEESNAFWTVAKKYKIEEALRAFAAKFPGEYACQGEVYGPGIQGNKTKADEVKLALFNFFSIKHQKYANFDVFMEFCVENSLPFVPVVWAGVFKFSLQDLVDLAGKQEYAPGLPAEGIVIRSVKDQESEVLKGRMSFKILNDNFCLKYGE